MKVNDLKVCVVEDDSFQRKMIMEVLRSLGITSICDAGDGKQALDKIRAEKVKSNIVICDLSMPEMDGLEFLRHLGESNQNVAVIIISAFGNKLLVSAGKMAKMLGIKLLGVMEKPVTLAQLKELLENFERAADKADAPGVTHDFTLDEILHGIGANQFKPFFQPKVDFKSGRLIGAEALARWNKPGQGIIAPSDFIPQLEQSGNIDELTFQMLAKSAEACRFFQDTGHALTISVNLSLASLSDPGLADKITKIVREAGAEPHFIVLEVTESAAMSEVAVALENLARLCINGFSLSIDDYGTGYSSLQQLTRIPFNELKIDQSFVKDFEDNEASRIVVESSIAMAHKLNIKSVAEGVESQEDWNALKNLGCDVAQGYLVAKPMDVREFYEFAVNCNFKFSGVPAATPQEKSGLKILVVDDDGFARKLFLNVLHFLGYSHITDTDSAESALKLLENNAFDLIVSDIHMPGMTGLEFVQLIRAGKTHARRDTRIVMLTAFSRKETLAAVLAMDINGFLVKPITPADVDEKISQALAEQLHLHPPVAYEAVRIDLDGGAVTADKLEHDEHVGAAILRAQGDPPAKGAEPGSYEISIRRLKPGMKLIESIVLADGTKLLSAGHVFTEQSINRLHDLASLLPDSNITIQ